MAKKMTLRDYFNGAPMRAAGIKVRRRAQAASGELFT